MDIYDIIDNIYKLPLASKEALLNETPEVTYPKGFHLFLANRKSSKFYLMKKGMLHAYTYKSDKKVTPEASFCLSPRFAACQAVPSVPV